MRRLWSWASFNEARAVNAGTGDDVCRAGTSQRKRMVDRAGTLDSQLAGHDGKVARAAPCVIIKNRPVHDPFTSSFGEAAQLLRALTPLPMGDNLTP